MNVALNVAPFVSLLAFNVLLLLTRMEVVSKATTDGRLCAMVMHCGTAPCATIPCALRDTHAAAALSAGHAMPALHLGFHCLVTRARSTQGDGAREGAMASLLLPRCSQALGPPPLLVQVAVDVFRKQREEHAISDRVIAELTAAKAAREAERREEAAISQRQQEVAQHQQVRGAEGASARPAGPSTESGHSGIWAGAA